MKKPSDLSYLNDLVRSRLEYDAESGNLIWLPKRVSRSEDKRWNTRFAGKIAGKLSDKGYMMIGLRIGGRDKMILAHRVCWFLHYGKWPMSEIDHENHNRKDNRIINLRVADRGSQARNMSMNKRNTSGITGVDFYRGKWRAQCAYKGRRYLIGMYERKHDAAAAISEFRASRDYHKNHGAPLNDQGV